MGKGGGDQTVNQVLDPETQKYVQSLRGVASNYAREVGQMKGLFPGADPRFMQGVAGLQGLPGLSSPLFQRLTGGLGLPFDPSSYAQFMDPFQQNVIGGIQTDFDRQRELMSRAAAQQATAAGAFGGSRGAVLQAEGLRDIGQSEASTLAGLRSAGFNQAMQNALGLWGQGQQLGFGALGLGSQLEQARAQGLMGAGDYLRQIAMQQAQEPIFRGQTALNFLNLGLGPYGSTQQQQSASNPLGGMLGGAAAGFGVGGPIGGIVGGGLGLLGGLF